MRKMENNQIKFDKICELIWHIPSEKWESVNNGWAFKTDVNGKEIFLLLGELNWPAIHIGGAYFGGKRDGNIKLKERIQKYFMNKKNINETNIDDLLNSLIEE